MMIFGSLISAFKIINYGQFTLKNLQNFGSIIVVPWVTDSQSTQICTQKSSWKLFEKVHFMIHVKNQVRIDVIHHQLQLWGSKSPLLKI